MVRGKGNQFQSADPPDFFCLFVFATVATEDKSLKLLLSFLSRR